MKNLKQIHLKPAIALVLIAFGFFTCNSSSNAEQKLIKELKSKGLAAQVKSA